MVFERSPPKKPPGPGPGKPAPAAQLAGSSSASTDTNGRSGAGGDDIDWITSGLEPMRASDFVRQPWLSPPGQKARSDAAPAAAFGQPSELGGSHAHLFNIPKTNRNRPEFHRGKAVGLHRPPPSAAVFRNPLEPRAQPPAPAAASGSLDDVVEIAKPQSTRNWADGLVATPLLYSSQQQPVLRRVDVDLTDPAFSNDTFGGPGLYDYVDTEKATQDIKALLEGAFDEDEDGARRRGKKKKAENEMPAATENAAEAKDASPDRQGEAEQEEDEAEDDGSVEGLKVKLLPHQAEGVEWMQDKEIGTRKIKGSRPKGGILADDMGLGKTIQSMALILTNPRPAQKRPNNGKEDKDALSNAVGKGTLIVAPLALIKQWEAEIDAKVADSHRLRVLVHHGPARTKRFEDLKKYDVVITTYQILVSERASSSDQPEGQQYGCFGIHWYRVILDEAHTIKNRNAKATQACYSLRAEYRWCLTGTPMQNNLEELQSLIRFLRIKPYNDLAVWRQQIQQPMNAGRGAIAMRRLQYYLKAFMKRRTKDILKKEGALNPGGHSDSHGPNRSGFKITERRIKKLEIEFSPKERLFYERLEARADKSLEQMASDANMSYASALTLLLRLRQACNHAQLVTKPKSKDKDAFAVDQLGNQSPSKTPASEGEIDDLADAFGALGVGSAKCDVCQIKLSPEEKAKKKVRCTECEADLVDQRKLPSSNNRSRRKGSKKMNKAERSRRPKERNRRIIEDSDEDDNEGEWIVSDDERPKLKLGRAGGSDDENAEGGGEWLNSDDSDTDDDEDSIQILGSHRKKREPTDVSEDSSSGEDSSGDSSGDSQESESEADVDAESLMTSTKIRKLLEILRRESGEHKFIVFSVFTSMLDIIEPCLRKENLVFTRYDGSMRNDLREASLDRLRNDRRTRIMLCSLKCGSLGLNLTAASRVVILEPFWNPFVEEQAIDRVHRLNQTVDVTVYKLTIMHTVEERIFDLQEKKRALAAAAIEGKSIAKLSMQDILNLFKHDNHGSEPPEDAGLGAKPPVLSRGMLLQEEAEARAEVVAASGRAPAGPRHTTPPEGRKPRPAESSVFGRRW